MRGSADGNSNVRRQDLLGAEKNPHDSHAEGAQGQHEDLWLISMRENGVDLVSEVLQNRRTMLLNQSSRTGSTHILNYRNTTWPYRTLKKLDSMPDGGRLPNVVVPILRGWHIGVQISEIFCFVNRFQVFCVFMSHFYCRYENG